MLKYVIKRIILAFFTTVIILTLTFLLMKLLPFQKPLGTIPEQLGYYEKQVYLGYVESFDRLMPNIASSPIWKYTNDKGQITYYYVTPALQQYFSWVKNIITEWDWGTSTYVMPNVTAMYIILQYLPLSMKLNIISVLISVPIGILLGIWAALKKNTLTDHFISTLVMIFISIPSFILITILIYIFGIKLKWFPSIWPTPSAPDSQKFLGYFIPVTALSFGSICGYCRFTRAELCEVMSSEYLLLARTKGLTKRQAIVRHALRNAMVPILPSILAEFIAILGGSMILENLYGIPGIGFLFVTALNSKDYNVLMVDMAVTTIIGLVAGVFLDISYGFIDPRIRMGAKK